MVLHLVVQPIRAVLRSLQTDRTGVSMVRKLLAGAVLVPLFGIVVVALRVRVKLRGALETETALSDGSRFACRLPDLVQLYIYMFGVWEPDLTAFLKRTLVAGDVFVDIGANIGYFSIRGARLVGERGRVAAIEPCPTILRSLQRNLALNSQPAARVGVIERAVSDHTGELLLHLGPTHNLGLTSPVGGHKGVVADVSVPCAPLGELLDVGLLERASVIKIDVEGGEPAVLRGILRSVAALREDVQMIVELSPAWWSDRMLTPQAVLGPWIDAGFHVYAIENNYWPWRYLWPNDVRPPRRLRKLPAGRPNRMDLILSRRDAEEL